MENNLIEFQLNLISFLMYGTRESGGGGLAEQRELFRAMCSFYKIFKALNGF
jgi:hypothetical protein